MTEGSVELGQIRRSFTDFVQNGVLDNRVLATLSVEDKFISKECELWDFKREAGKDAASVAETVLQIVSFYNTYGGYLVYGVDEAIDDTEFTACGIENGQLDLQQIRQQLANYTGESIDISYRELDHSVAGRSYTFGIMHIPKRSAQAPVFLGKDGPQKKDGRSIFRKDTAYLRVLEQCLPATTREHFKLLFSRRDNEYLWDPGVSSASEQSTRIIIEHNLPDRAFICSRFFGRDSEIEQLWRWLGDELSNTKLLAGDGGKGKTSIAYEFAEEVCRTKPCSIEKVVWLTAKTRQFVAERDAYINVPRTDFYDLESLLKAMCAELAVLDSEVDGASIPMLKKYLKKALDIVPCLIVVDNVDSTPEDQQRLIFETAMQFPGSLTRFLLTTRVNRMFSGDQCITIGGLDENDYQQYVTSLLSRFKCPPLTPKEIDEMRRVTGGSPLFTESMLRLERVGIPHKQAMRDWQGKDGVEVRKAALQHEVDSLSIEAKRVLMAASYMREASFTELKQVTGYTDSKMRKCIEELNSFFLIETKPLVKKELRFAVSDSIATLVLETAENMVMNPAALRDAISRLRSRAVPVGGRKPRYSASGAALGQSRAMLRDGDYAGARATAEAGLTVSKNDPDLIFQLAICAFEESKNKDTNLLGVARATFRKSYQAGQRKQSLFACWYDAEVRAKDHSSAVEVAAHALEQEDADKTEWLKRRASAYADLSKSLERVLNTDLAIMNMKKAVADVGKAIETAGHIQRLPLQETLGRLDDGLWILCRREASSDVSGNKELFDTAKWFMAVGDDRQINYERLLQSVTDAANSLLDSGKASPGQINLVQNLLDQSVRLVRRRLSTSGLHRQDIEKKMVMLKDLVNKVVQQYRL